MAGISFWALSTFRSGSALSSAYSQTLETILRARSQTLSGINKKDYGVHFEETIVALYEGPIYSADASENEIFVLPTEVHISDIGFGGPSDVLFTRLLGVPTVSGAVTISLRSDSNQSRTITIFSSGAIE